MDKIRFGFICVVLLVLQGCFETSHYPVAVVDNSIASPAILNILWVMENGFKNIPDGAYTAIFVSGKLIEINKS